jgi:hypothetical protein
MLRGNMNVLQLITTLFPLAVTSGINLYLTVLVAGLCIQFKVVQSVPAGLEPLGTWPIISVAGVLFLVEALVDKIPLLDSIWDVIHTVIRPLGGALLAYSALNQADPALGILGGLASGSLSLVAHGGKASTRAAINVASPAEGCSNIFMSSGEDVVAGLVTFIAFNYPWVAFGITLAILIVIIIFAPKLIRWVFYTFRSIYKRIKGFFGQKQVSEALPFDHSSVLNHMPSRFSIESMAQSLAGCSGSSGYLSLFDHFLTFTYSHRRSEARYWLIPYPRVIFAKFRKSSLMDVLEVEYFDDKNVKRKARFTFQKDSSKLAEQFAGCLAYNVQQAIQSQAYQTPSAYPSGFVPGLQ